MTIYYTSLRGSSDYGTRDRSQKMSGTGGESIKVAVEIINGF